MAEQSLESIRQWLMDILTPPKRRTEDINLEEENDYGYLEKLLTPEPPYRHGPELEVNPPLPETPPTEFGEQVPADQSIPQSKWQGARPSDSDIEGQFQHLMPQPSDQAAQKWAEMVAADSSGMAQALFGGAVGPARPSDRDITAIASDLIRRIQGGRQSDEDLKNMKQALLTMLDDNKKDNKKLEEFWRYLPN